MKLKYLQIISAFAICLFIISMPMLASAQSIDDTPIVPEAPLDGGLSLLVAAGVGYGAKKLKDKRSKAKI